jgi:Superinfection immunity protein
MEFLILLLVMYFVPWVVAGVRGHPQQNSIMVLNLFLGWTFIGWVIALIWAVSAFEKKA